MAANIQNLYSGAVWFISLTPCLGRKAYSLVLCFVCERTHRRVQTPCPSPSAWCLSYWLGKHSWKLLQIHKETHNETQKDTKHWPINSLHDQPKSGWISNATWTFPLTAGQTASTAFLSDYHEVVEWCSHTQTHVECSKEKPITTIHWMHQQKIKPTQIKPTKPKPCGKCYLLA